MLVLPDKTAVTQAAIHPLLAGRWSPRNFDGGHELDNDELVSLLEAARWAPSANNSQPWRFVVGHRGDATFAKLVETLMPGNQLWAPRASVLVLALAETTDEQGNARPWALHDTGQAVAALTLQAEALGLSVHQMGGFHADMARDLLPAGGDLRPVVMIAIGRHDPAGELPERLAARELAVRTRRPLEELVVAV